MEWSYGFSFVCQSIQLAEDRNRRNAIFLNMTRKWKNLIIFPGKNGVIEKISGKNGFVIKRTAGKNGYNGRQFFGKSG